jgi:hypothetical protein
MSRRYKVLLPLTVHTGDGAYAQGEEFDKDFTAEDEAENVASGLLEVLPMTYRVVGGSRVHETDPGETFEAALPLGQEQLLIEGGHIERVEPKKPIRKKKDDPDGNE